VKKIIAVLLCLLCLSPFAISGCNKNNSNTDSQIIDLANCEIGYELPVYPECEFNYKINEECTVHVKSIKATLIQKNTISENDTLDSEFHPYIIHISAIGSTDMKFEGKELRLNLRIDKNFKTQYYYLATVNNNGIINWEYDQTDWSSYTKILFESITLN
jgi:uncharacterized protein YxeA